MLASSSLSPLSPVSTASHVARTRNDNNNNTQQQTLKKPMKRLQTQSNIKSMSRSNSKPIELNLEALETLETPRHTLHSDVDYTSAPSTAKVPTSPTCDTPDSPESAFYDDSYNPENITSNNNVAIIAPNKIKQEPKLEIKLEPKLDLDPTNFTSKDICLAASLDLPSMMQTDNHSYCHTSLTDVRQMMNFNVKRESMMSVAPTSMLTPQSSIMSSVPTTTMTGTTGTHLDDSLLGDDPSLNIGRPVKLEELMNNFPELPEATPLSDLEMDVDMMGDLDFKFTRSPDEMMEILNDNNDWTINTPSNYC